MFRKNLTRLYYKYFSDCVFKRFTSVFRVAQKVSYYQNIKKSYYVVLKHVNEIRFIVKLQYKSTIIILFVSIRYSIRDLLSDLNNYAWPAN